MAKKKSNTAALVEHNVADEEHPERLPLEETWPTESAAAPEDDGTEVFSARECPEPLGPEDFPGSDEGSHFMSQTPARELGLSTEGPFIAPAQAELVAASTTNTVSGKRAKTTVASMTREHAFTVFRDKLFELCFKYGFTLEADADTLKIEAFDIGDAKGTAKRALAVGNHISGLELRK